MGQVQRLSLLAAALPGLTALVALLFTWMSVGQTRSELRIAEQGQITNRFNAAINNLGSGSEDVRLGGIHALQRIMQDSPRDQPTIVSVLSAYARRHARVPASGFVKEQEDIAESLESPVRPATDVEAVLSVLADRSADHDERARLDLRRTDLRGAEVIARVETPKSGAPFRAASFNEADLRHSTFDGVDLRNVGFFRSNLAAARLDDVDLSSASMEGADLTRTTIWHANLTRADLNYAKLHEAQLNWAVNLTKATLLTADLTGANLEGANLRNAALIGANLRDAYLAKAKLHGARLSNVDQEALAVEFGWYIEKNGNLAKADLTGADLTNADLRGVDLTEAVLVDADLRGAKLAGVKLTRAKLNGVRGLPPSLRP
ncbi:MULTISPECIES: pentapeptide repeat-containing protein [unclassified Streptomyces]|uniref:pentapeptide repeat-containing protein n=1 Tax=unclassified Streptomyces TaxID=2593676 RepID=UPI002E805DD1|nr:pentapeptide repeat-containing protein [Streptomyces sp. NBC_00589]WTI42230.1 pentapeptide repeat-containing protein [Streptomyces sp. NBC_00775]WUB24088.1 pentapeptide repeat-containing protein [Streptomyces sp. NBC_00589]